MDSAGSRPMLAVRSAKWRAPRNRAATSLRSAFRGAKGDKKDLPSVNGKQVSLDRNRNLRSSRHVHAHEELGVRLRLAGAVGEHFHRLDRMHVAEDAAEDADALHGVGMDEELLFTSAGAVDVDRGPDALV